MMFRVKCVETSLLVNITEYLLVMDVLASSRDPSEEDESMDVRVETLSHVSLIKLIVTSAEDVD